VAVDTAAMDDGGGGRPDIPEDGGIPCGTCICPGVMGRRLPPGDL